MRRFSGNPCRACGVRSGSHSRGLCYPCYHSPARASFPCRSPERMRLGINAYKNPTRPATRPTAALPGTPAKVKEMARRIRYGQSLFHLGDARHAD